MDIHYTELPLIDRLAITFSMHVKTQVGEKWDYRLYYRFHPWFFSEFHTWFFFGSSLYNCRTTKPHPSCSFARRTLFVVLQSLGPLDFVSRLNTLLLGQFRGDLFQSFLKFAGLHLSLLGFVLSIGQDMAAAARFLAALVRLLLFLGGSDWYVPWSLFLVQLFPTRFVSIERSIQRNSSSPLRVQSLLKATGYSFHDEGWYSSYVATMRVPTVWIPRSNVGIPGD